MEGFTIGRIVHFVMPNGLHRPAIIVEAWPDGTSCEGYANLQVFTDGHNDITGVQELESKVAIEDGIWWQASVCFDNQEKKPRTWHWPEYVGKPRESLGEYLPIQIRDSNQDTPS